MELPEEQRLPAFIRNQLRPGVSPPTPPPGPPPPWMSSRPGALAAFVRVFRTTHLDRDGLRSFDLPVYFALGGSTTPHNVLPSSTRPDNSRSASTTLVS